MVATGVDTLTAPSDMKNGTMAAYVLDEIQLFVPIFNLNTSMNGALVLAGFEYPISSKS